MVAHPPRRSVVLALRRVYGLAIDPLEARNGAFVVVVPAVAVLIWAVNTWSAIHGAGGEGFALVALLVVGWGTPLPSIWSLRPRRNAEKTG